jgi:hypothetical protein
MITDRFASGDIFFSQPISSSYDVVCRTCLLTAAGCWINNNNNSNNNSNNTSNNNDSNNNNYNNNRRPSCPMPNKPPASGIWKS